MAADATTRSRDRLVRAVSPDGVLAVRAFVATRLVREATRRHATAPTASAALGRTLMGTVLLAAGTKHAETLQVQVRGDGPIGQILAVAEADGRVRGYAHNPDAHLPPRADGKLDVGALVGKGVLAVVRHHASWSEPYTGLVPIVSGEIAEDLAHYLQTSEQRSVALALGVFVGPSLEVEAAGGYLVEALPGASETTLARLEDVVSTLGTPTELIRGGHDADAIAGLLLGELRDDADALSPRFHCPCSRERIERAVTLLGRSGIREMVDASGGLDMRCEFCTDTYRVSAEQLGALLPDA